ncbi:MAG: hypothetical protein V3V84_03410, partial [Candidatus Bathyarchaeia archaeon]
GQCGQLPKPNCKNYAPACECGCGYTSRMCNGGQCGPKPWDGCPNAQEDCKCGCGLKVGDCPESQCGQLPKHNCKNYAPACECGCGYTEKSCDNGQCGSKPSGYCIKAQTENCECGCGLKLGACPESQCGVYPEKNCPIYAPPCDCNCGLTSKQCPNRYCGWKPYGGCPQVTEKCKCPCGRFAGECAEGQCGSKSKQECSAYGNEKCSCGCDFSINTCGYNIGLERAIWKSCFEGSVPGCQISSSGATPPSISNLYPMVGVEVLCPVDVLITDSEGRLEGRLHDGTIVREIPGTYLFLDNVEDGQYWLFGLPEGEYDVQITGTKDGTFNLRTSFEEGQVQEYGEQPITQGSRANLGIDPDNPAKRLALPNGEFVEPTTVSSAGKTWFSVLIEKVPGRSIGLVGIVVVVLVLTAAIVVSKRTRKRGKPGLSAAQTAFCLECGAPKPEDKLYCTKCGAKQK